MIISLGTFILFTIAILGAKEFIKKRKITISNTIINISMVFIAALFVFTHSIVSRAVINSFDTFQTHPTEVIELPMDELEETIIEFSQDSSINYHIVENIEDEKIIITYYGQPRDNTNLVVFNGYKEDARWEVNIYTTREGM